MLLPLATDLTIVAKLSSAKTIEAASLLTSVPVIPIATPTSAFFNAGASFTPSPVIATMCPNSCHSVTILILCAGLTLAYTLTLGSISESSLSLIISSSAPSRAKSPSLKIPTSRATAIAVILWSPVIMTGFIPALIQSATAALLSSLGGSVIAHNPINVYLFSSFSLISVLLLNSRFAKHNTRIPRSE